MRHLSLACFSLLILTVAVGACGPPTEESRATDPSAMLPDAVESAVKEALGARTGLPIEEIEVVAVQERQWPDACLGLDREDETCAQVITPGWKVKLRAEEEEYIFHADEEGTAIRMEE